MARQMNKITISDAQANLPSILQRLAPGEELLIVLGDKPIAKLTREIDTSGSCKAGSARHRDHWMANDFDDPIEDFAEYME